MFNFQLRQEGNRRFLGAQGAENVGSATASRRRVDKILQQLQTDLLALLRMKLRREHVLLPNRRGEALAVGRARRDDRGVNWFGKKAVHEINVAAAWNAAQNWTIRSDHLDLVPADLRNLQPRFLGKTDHLAWEDSQPRGAAIELLALLEQRLVADADSEEQPARSNEIAARLEQVLLLQRVQAIVEPSDPWQHSGADILHLGRV